MLQFKKKTFEKVVLCAIIKKERNEIKMKKNNIKNKKVKNKEQRHYDKGQIFVKVMAAFLAVLMVGGTGITLIYALMG